MNNLKSYVNWKLTHSDKIAEAEGYPLTMPNCKPNKKMKQLEIYGNSVQDGTPTPDNPIEVESVGEFVTDINDVNYGKYKIPLLIKGDVETITHCIYLNEPLRKIGDYADYIDFKNNKVVRNTFVRVYDSKTDNNNPFSKSDNEENWAGSENHGDVTENFWAYTLNDTLPIIPKYGHHSAKDFQQVPICLQLPVKTGYYDSNTSDATINKEMIWVCQQSRGVRLYLSKDRVGGTRNNILTYLKNNPITVLFATYQPYEEPITLDLPKLTAKTTVIEVDTSIAPSKVYGKYIKR